MSSRTLELWYEFASTYSYLAVERVEQVVEAARIAVVWKPFLLGPIFRSQGWNDSPFNLYPAKGRYMWRDVERLAQGYGLPFRQPSAFPRNGLLAARVALIAGDEGFCPEFTRAVYRAEFAEDRDIGEREVIADLLRALGHAPEPLIEAALAPRNKDRLGTQTERAVELGIFGAPSFLVDGELYWGNDRLGDAIARCALGS